MRKRLTALFRDDSLRGASLRSSLWTISGFGGESILRLGANLILTRLLFPEVFGLMALVQVFMGGMQMFSDLGIRASIIQNKRGDDPDFLNTAWTLQIIRGLCLFLGSCLLAFPAAWIYDEPMLIQLLPAVGISAIIQGFHTTKAANSSRHLILGRMTVIGLCAQTVNLMTTIILAWLIGSVWALVIGAIVGAFVSMMAYRTFIPGENNKLHWEWEAACELVGFGKYIFLSTAAGLLIKQSDRAILGAYVSLATLGIYNIGFFMGTVMFILVKAAVNKVVFPLYRMSPPSESPQNRANMLRARRLVTGAGLAGTAVLAFLGPDLIDFLYDPRYLLAGPMMTVFGLAIVPQIVFAGYPAALLSTGDSRRFFVFNLTTALCQVAFLFVGIQWLGVFGAIIGPGLAALATYPLMIVYARKYDAWDGPGDALFLGFGLAVHAAICWWHWPLITQLLQ